MFATLRNHPRTKLWAPRLGGRAVGLVLFFGAGLFSGMVYS